MKNKNLIATRKLSDKTQVQVANKTKLTERTYQKYESGMSSKTIQTAIRIAKSVRATVIMGQRSCNRLTGTTRPIRRILALSSKLYKILGKIFWGNY